MPLYWCMTKEEQYTSLLTAVELFADVYMARGDEANYKMYRNSLMRLIAFNKANRETDQPARPPKG